MPNMQPLLYKKLLRDLFAVSLSKKFTTWEQVQDYAKSFKKYDDLTFRDLDKVLKALNIE